MSAWGRGLDGVGCQQDLPQCHKRINAFRRLSGGSSWNDGRVQTLQLPQVSFLVVHAVIQKILIKYLIGDVLVALHP